MDPETQRHIDAARRPPERKNPRRADGEQLPPTQPEQSLPEKEAQLQREVAQVAAGQSAPVDADAAGGLKHTEIPASRYVQQRKDRERDRVVATLDRIAPVEVRQVKQGTVWTVTVPCGGCGCDVKLVSDSFTQYEFDDDEVDVAGEPGLRARMVAAGWLRTSPVNRKKGGRHSGVMCDTCEAEAEREEVQRQISNERQSRLSDAVLPKALQGFEFDQMERSGLREGDRETAIGAARTWATEKRVEEKPGLLIFGTKGAGKTRLAATAAWERLRSHDVKWVSWPALVGQLLGAFDDDDRKVAASILNGNGALILDDIARDEVSVSDWVKTQLFVAIDRRVQAGAPILLTTNLTGTAAEPENPIAALGERLGPSVASRLVGYCRIVELPGQDNRLKFDYRGNKKLTPAEQEAARVGLQEQPESD